MKQVKGHGFIRKNKAGKVVSGIVLGTAMFMASGVASADEVKPTEVKPTETVVTEAKAEEKTDKVETKETPKAEEVKDQEGLDKKYSELTEQAKKQNVEVKEGEKVTHDTVANASKDLDEQSKKIDELAKGRDEANAKLQKAIEDAKAVGIKVELEDKVTYSDLAKGEEDIAKQVEELTALTTKVKDAQGRLAKVVADAKQAGVKFEGVKLVELKDVEEAEKALNEIIAQQKSVDAELSKLVADAKAKGVNVTVEGETVVSPKDAQKAIADAKAKIAKAVADAEAKNKTIRENNAKVNEANKNAKAELVSGSTATKNADGTYTQTVAVKNDKAGSKWNANLANSGSADVVSVKLVSPTGKETVFANGKIDSSKVLDEVGEYKLVYTFKAKDNTAGAITGKLNVEGQAGQSGKATGTAEFKTETPSTTTTKKKPRKLVLWLDRSSSFADKAGQNYIDTIANSLVDSMNEGDEMAVVGNINTIDFLAPGQMINFQTLTSDKSALKSAIAMKGDNGTASSNPVASSAATKVIGDNGSENLQAYLAKKNIAELFGNGAKASELTLVTLLDDTAIDVPTSTTLGQIQRFVKDGGQVLSYVPNVTKGQVDATERLLKQVGVKKENVELVDYNSGNPKAVADQIVKSLNTKTVVTVKGENQTANIVIGGEGVTVTKATLKGATNKELPITNGKVDFSEKLAGGTYTVEFEVTGNGTATATVKVDGKEASKKSVTVKTTEGSKGGTATKEDKLQPSKLGSTTPEVKPEGVKVSKISLKAEEPKVAPVEAKAHEIAVSSEVHPVDVVKPVVATPVKPQLPLTGTTASVALVMAGMGALTLAGVALKKKEN
jgi:LPXTG-motif cell wall-anchored protein